MSRQFRDYRDDWWKLWQARWYWVCSHGYTHHPWPDCPQTAAHRWRRRWYGPLPEWWDRWIGYPLRRLSCRLGRCTVGCRGRTDHEWITGIGTRRKRHGDQR